MRLVHAAFALTGWRALFPAAFAGALLPLAYAPFGIFPLAVVAIAMFCVLVRDVTPGTAFWRAYVFGLACFGVGVSWVAVSMVRFGGVVLPLATLLTALLVAFLALFPALAGYVFRRFFAGASLLWAMPALWVLAEWVRGWMFTGFPWLAVGYSQTDSPLAGYAPVFGVYGVSAAVVLSAVLLVGMVSGPLSRRWRHGIGLLLVWLLPLGLSATAWSELHGEPISVSLIQGNISQDQKWQPERRAMTIDLYARLTRENWGSDLIVWPETALPAFYHQAEIFLAGLHEEARRHDSDLLLGLPVMDDERPELYYNAMVGLGDDVGFYFKRHLVPFGEYIPLQGLLGDLMAILQVPLPDFAAGRDDQPLLQLAGQTLGISICYEDVFGEEVIMTLPEATVLVNVSNDAWFGDSLAPHQHLQIARMRAIETGRPLLRATNTGISALIDHRGGLMTTSPQFEVHVLTGVVQPMRGATPYVTWGNTAVIALCLTILAFSLWRCRRQN